MKVKHLWPRESPVINRYRNNFFLTKRKREKETIGKFKVNKINYQKFNLNFDLICNVNKKKGNYRPSICLAILSNMYKMRERRTIREQIDK